jgi:hypothetical protein
MRGKTTLASASWGRTLRRRSCGLPPQPSACCRRPSPIVFAQSTTTNGSPTTQIGSSSTQALNGGGNATGSSNAAGANPGAVGGAGSASGASGGTGWRSAQRGLGWRSGWRQWWIGGRQAATLLDDTPSYGARLRPAGYAQTEIVTFGAALEPSRWLVEMPTTCNKPWELQGSGASSHMVTVDKCVPSAPKKIWAFAGTKSLYRRPTGGAPSHPGGPAVQ